MTRAFSTKRRRVAGSLSRMQQGIASHIPRGQTSEHAGSKPTFIHFTDTGPARRFAAAQEWAQATGRPLPPQMRARQPLQPPVPLGSRDRWNRYTVQNAAEWLTPAQRRRFRHKHGRRELAVFEDGKLS